MEERTEEANAEAEENEESGTGVLGCSEVKCCNGEERIMAKMRRSGAR